VSDNIYSLSISLAHLLSFHESTIFSVFFCPFPCSFTCVTWRSFRFQTDRQTDRQTDSLQFFSFQIASPPPYFWPWYSRSSALQLLPVFHPQGTQISSYSQCRFVLWSCLLYSSPDIRFKTSPSDTHTKPLWVFKEKIMFCLMFLISVSNIHRTLIQGQFLCRFGISTERPAI
jgi:hypothetical protein